MSPAVAAEDTDVASPEQSESVTRETGTAESASPSPAPTTDAPSQPGTTPAPVTRPAPSEPDRLDPGFDPTLSVENHPAARPLPEPSFDREWVAKAATAYAAARAMPVNEAEPKELPPLTLIEVERRPGMPVPRSIAEDPDRVPSFMRQRAEMSRALRLALRVVAPVLALTLAGQALWLFHDEVAAALPATRPALEAACARARCVIELPKRAHQLRVASAELRQTSEDGGHDLHVGLRNESHWNQAWPVLDVSLTDVQGKLIARRMLAATDYLPAQPDAARLARDGLAANAEQQLVVPLRIDATGVVGYTVDAFFP
ncbi:DUF3426 domain-containing protein [Derxia gummosa]|uniref:DUF3426 domain-containing protein n=1 Tax=Derxia gummosa DSM 723 TaxID=1121388 RepID=A0A9U5FXS0_9BURK|nr:DUF3426 domain-containing protein [Derxia gummosa]